MSSSRKWAAADLLAQLESDYGPDGSGMNFGRILMPVIRAAKSQLPADVQLSEAELLEVLSGISNFGFVDKARRDPQAATAELVGNIRRIAGS